MLSANIVLTPSVINVSGVSVGATYDIPLGNPTLYVTEIIGFFTISGTGVLTSSLTIDTTYTPTAPMRLTFLSRANMTLAGNDITIFGLQLTQYQASNPFEVTAWWDGISWSAVLEQIPFPVTGLPNSDLEDMPGMTVKMNSGLSAGKPQDITVVDTRKVLNTEYDLINCVIDFNSGHLYRQDILIPFQGEVTKVFGWVTQDIEISDDATVAIGIAGSAGGGFGTMSTIIFEAGQNAGTFDLDIPTSGPLTEFAANNYLAFQPQKITWGGRALFTVVVKRT